MDLLVNGATQGVRSGPERPLLYVLRDELDLTGAKYGCGEGQCGACTVLLDGVATRSCLVPVAGVAGRQVTTIEGLEKHGELHPLQQAFLEADALQCGYCTPGMIVSALGLLQKNPGATEAEIRRHMEGNLCRCGAYPRILQAVQAAGKRMREGSR